MSGDIRENSHQLVEGNQLITKHIQVSGEFQLKFDNPVNAAINISGTASSIGADIFLFLLGASFLLVSIALVIQTIKQAKGK